MKLGGRAVGVFVVGLVGALVTALMAVLPATGAQAAGDLVTFPYVQAINPKVTPYSITINDAGGAGHLVARWAVDRSGLREIELPHEGVVTLPFEETFTDNFTTSVYVSRCPNPTWVVDTCKEVAYSQMVSVWIKAEMTMTLGAAVGVEAVAVPFTYSPTGVGTTTWRLLTADGSELATGRTDAGSGGQLVLAVPPGTPEQLGALDLETSLDGTRVGHLDGRVSIPIKLDGVPPPVPTIALSALVVYPYGDKYRDFVSVSVHTPGAVSYNLDAVNEVTGVVHRVHWGGGSDEPFKVSFPSDDRVRRPIPAGSYQLRLVSTDWGGRSYASSLPIEVRWDRVVMRNWHATVPAAKTVIKKHVGSCGSLRRPAEPGWRGSLGYYSGTCRDQKQALVQVIHAVEVPPALNGAYGHFKVSLTGGPNRKRPGSYLVLGYYTNARNWQFKRRRVLRGRGVAVRQGHMVRSRVMETYIHDDGNGPYVAWSTGLASGSRYDVKNFRVHIGYKALVPGSPDD